MEGVEYVCTSANRPVWLRERQSSIGSSDAAAVIGASKWRTPMQVWAAKTGYVSDFSDEDAPEYIYWGTVLEPIVIAEYSKRTGHKTFGGGELLRSQKYAFMSATCDSFIEAIDERGTGILEIKTTSSYMADQWRDEPPPHVQTQVQHQLAVTGLQWGVIAVLLGGQQYRQYAVERNNKFCDWLIEQERAFWELVETKTPPPVDGHEKTQKVLAEIFGKPLDVETPLPIDALHWDDEIKILAAQAAEIKERETLLKNKIREQLGAATVGQLPGGEGRWTWRADKRGNRVLRRSK